MRKIVLLCAALSPVVSGCGGDSANNVAQVPAKKADIRILGSDSDYAAVVQTAYNDPSKSRNPTADRAVAEKCGLRPSTPQKGPLPAAIPALIAPVVIAVIGWVAKYVVTEVSKALQREIQEYSGTASGAVQFGPLAAEALQVAHQTGRPQPYFYKAIPSSRGGAPELGWSCVRLQRMVEKDVASEVIIRIEVAPTNDSLIIRPLRLYFDQPVAQKVDTNPAHNADGFYGVSVGLQFDGLWQGAASGEGKAAMAWAATDMIKQSIKIHDPQFQRFYYYNVEAPATDPSDKTPKPMSRGSPKQVPLVPWSVNTAAGMPGGSGTLTITMAEVGNVPPLLTFFAGLIKDNSSQISGLLAGAAEAALGLK